MGPYSERYKEDVSTPSEGQITMLIKFGIPRERALKMTKNQANSVIEGKMQQARRKKGARTWAW